MKIAALDVDGTLLPGALADPLPALLVDAGLTPRDRAARLRDVVATGRPEDPPPPEVVHRLFAALFTDVPVRAVSALIAGLWQERRQRLFDFTRPLVAALRGAGYTPVLISGGPEELVAHLAAELGVERFRGTRFAVEDDLYTGLVESTVEGVKDKVALDLADGAVAWSRSLAIGNSLGEVELFRQVGQPIAFEPSPALLALARDHAWHVADRHDLPAVVRDRLGLDWPSPRPAPPPAPTGPPRLRAAADRLVDHVLRGVTPAGSIPGTTQSRVTESALMLTLLRRENMHPAAQHALRVHLLARAPGAGPFDAAVIASTLHGTPVPDRERLIDKTFEGSAQHPSPRHRLALAAILAAVGPEPFHVDAPAEAFEHRDGATWTRLRMMAIHHLNSADPVAPELTARLLRLTEVGQRRGVIERQAFSHLFALLALTRVAPGHPVVRAGVDALAACLNTDGGMPFATTEEVLVTSTAGLALARAGVDRRVLLAMGDYLAGRQADDGGWSNAEDVVQTDAGDTAHVVAFLHAVDPDRYRAHGERARRFLRDRVGPDGGVSTYFAGHPAEPATTADTVLALAPHAHAHRPLIERAAGFVLRAQRCDGTFGRGRSLSEAEAVFRALAALRFVHRRDPMAHEQRIGPAVRAAQRRLLTTANPDGGWGQAPGDPSDPISTAYSLVALAAEHRDSGVVRAGTAYLLREQDEDGGYTSIPDQAAPRPLPHGVTELANNFVLLAMTHLDPDYRHSGGRHG
ncbi:haloacid dehalogenase-like hydrolase [Saccharothrix syringae]|uniref:haloacid dehalogenase-like hydrolase n=1 Tax=Saccharothrix syringae TaxID=103733 RepID=UPI00068BB6B6|nr:haloacid dehalogenase-like hydrolase [Saccharothrix syringae]